MSTHFLVNSGTAVLVGVCMAAMYEAWMTRAELIGLKVEMGEMQRKHQDDYWDLHTKLLGALGQGRRVEERLEELLRTKPAT